MQTSNPHRDFVSRVQVWSTTGRYLYRTHPEHAARLVSAGATPEKSKKLKRIFRVTLAVFDRQRIGRATRPHPRIYGTAPAVIVETLGNLGTRRLAAYTFTRVLSSDDMLRLQEERSYLLEPEYAGS